MADADVGDLLALDRDVARATLALTRWRAALAADPEAHADEAPLEGWRNVAGKSTWDALARFPASAADALLVDGLGRWVYTLLQARLAHADEVAWARATAAARGIVGGDDPRRVSWREAWRAAVHARTPGEAQELLDAAAEAGPHLAAVAARIDARRAEVAKRLQLTHPWEPIVGLSARAVRASAGRFLDATDDLWRSLQRARPNPAVGASAVIHAAVARDAGDGWPGRLTPRWLHEIFGSPAAGLEVDLPVLPATVGAASFARGLSAFGFALRVAMAPRTMPFAVAREPGFIGAHRLAFVFGALGADPEFHVRALGVGQRTAHAQARSLACTALIDARLHAARVLLGDAEGTAPRELFEEVGERLFGLPLDPRLRGAWPRARDDEPARFVALVQAGALRESLRQRFDVDWFKNPRAWSELRSQGSEPARKPVDEAVVSGPGVEALALAFESALG
jgi:hypothetical protein